MRRNILLLFVFVLSLLSCENQFDPAVENFKDLDFMYTDPKFAQGVLTSAYRYLPDEYSNTEYATDDAVTNDRGNSYLQMATGSWTASYNPVGMWVDGYGAIQTLNTFIERSDDVNWVEDPEVAELFNMRMKGEAYGLRGVFLYYILRNHGGYSVNGDLLGVPILTEFQDSGADFNIPRASYQECVEQILSDLDMAISLLPIEYNNVAGPGQIPDKYANIVTLSSNYNRVMGDFSNQLLNGQIAMAFRSKVALMAASPAFQNGSNIGWDEAANYSADVLEYIGGISGLASQGDTYYSNTSELNGLSGGNNPTEILWRNNIETSRSSQESTNFPPSLFGDGRMNPTHNLVRAFPMSNGYPITHPSSGYDSSEPYINRDPRLSNYIVYDGSVLGVNDTPIYTGTNSGTDDAINRLENSTRTGYYMKKRLRMDVNYNNADGSWQGQINYTPRIRYTEIFLNYAEAANEAYGPTGASSNASYSAVDVIKAIRERALGITDDPYLDECSGDKNKMRDLIRNERRLELSFEGFRFWDLRRWDEDLNEPARGYDASTNEVFDVEQRLYEDYMVYGPIPFSEVLKYSALLQNNGWE